MNIVQEKKDTNSPEPLFSAKVTRLECLVDEQRNMITGIEEKLNKLFSSVPNTAEGDQAEASSSYLNRITVAADVLNVNNGRLLNVIKKLTELVG